MPGNEPVIRNRSDHCISRRDICPNALKVLYRLVRRGHTAYLVGGGVRDLLLGRRPKDFDVSTSAHPREIKKLFRNCFLIGRRFRLAHIKYGTDVIETSTFRRNPDAENDPDDPEASLLQNDDNTFGTPEEDALRRDFTINGLFYDIEHFSVIDYVGGLDDLDERLVRCIGDPDIRFREDPVRMIRAVRFASRLGFTIEKNTFDSLIRHKSEIQKASPPRMLEEIYRLFAFGSGEAAFRLLRETGLLGEIFPEIDSYLDEAGDNAPMWGYLKLLDDGLKDVPESTHAMMWASLLYDIILRRMDKYDGKARRAKLVEVSRDTIKNVSSSFPLPKRVADRFSRIIVAQEKLKPGKRRRFNKKGFVQQPYFAESLALYRQFTVVNGDSPESLENWRELYLEHGAHINHEEPPRRPRRRGRRRPGSSSLEIRPEGRQGELSGSAETRDVVSLDDKNSVNSSERKKKPRRRRGKKKSSGAKREIDISKPINADSFYTDSP